MNANRQRLKEIFHAAVELAPADRETFLKTNCAGDDRLYREVSALLSAHESAGDFIAQPALVDVGLVVDDETDYGAAVIGQPIGSYKITRELGRGGMGAVYLANRADQSFDKQVALKLIKRGMDSEAIIKRFVMERQILANLDHPNIARLIDGGTTADGLPYFVLEYIEGTTITRYCDQHKLNTWERLKLFRQICAAVQFAHQNLIVHRDLKPSNILVTGDGIPKLLDFGIAKLLSGATSVEATATISRALTPEYASPEELRGLSVTTSSDVYSLGVVLYELLSGHRPFNFQSRSPEDVARIITGSQPLKPSVVITRVEAAQPTDKDVRLTPETVSSTRDGSVEKLRRRLAGDLDNIILKALRKEPERRYASVQEFSDDIRRHLEGLPVTASPDSLGYRARKFTQRHKAGVLAAAIVIVTLLSATAITAWQARVARRERDNAQQRFNQVRKLANALLFEYHDGIEKLPGSTPIREKMVKDALEYLDNLSVGNSGDASLQNLFKLGNNKEALEIELKALAIDEEALKADPANANAQRDVHVDYYKIARVQAAIGDMKAAFISERKSIALIESEIAANPASSEARADLGEACAAFGAMLEKNGSLEQSLENYKKAAAIKQGAANADPANAVARGDLSEDYMKVGDVSLKLGDKTSALESYRKALAIREELLAANPDDVDGRIYLAHIYESLGAYSLLLANQSKRADDWQEAQHRYQQSVAIWVDLKGKGKLSADNARKPDEVSHKLAACNTALTAMVAAK